MFKKIIFGLVAFVVLLLVAAIVLPMVYKEKIKEIALQQINEQLNATVSLGDVKLSLFRSFPNFSFSLQDLEVVNHAPFEGDTLARIGEFRFEIDLMSVIRGDDLQVRSISMRNADLMLRMLADERVNWDITYPDTTELIEEAEVEATEFKFGIKKYSLENVNLVYDDDFFKQKAVIRGLNHRGTGDFTQDDFVLKTFTEIVALDYSFEGVKYLNKAKGKFDVPIAINMPNFTFTFTDNDLYLNELNLKFAGVVAMPETDIAMDLSFSTPQSDFRALLSVVPGVFNEYFEGITTSGKFVFDGKMKGIYNDEQMPAFDFKLLVNEGYFQYPDLPAAVKNIEMDFQLSNPTGDLDATVVDLKKFTLDLGGNPFSLKLKTITPMSDPFIDAAFKGKLNLAEVKNWYPVEEVKALQGYFEGDLTARGNMSAIENERYQDFTLLGNAVLSDFYTKYDGLEKGVEIKRAAMQFSPQFVQLSDFDLRMGTSDIRASGRIDNLVQYYFDADVLRGSFLVKSNLLNLNELMGEGESGTADAPASDSTSLEIIEIPGNIDFALNADFKRILYDNMEISNMQGALVLRDQSVGFRDVNMGLLGGTVQLAGTYSTKNPKKPEFDFNMGMQRFSMQESFTTFVTMQRIAPIGQYTSGEFSTGFGVNGILLHDMTPDLNSLAGGGLLKIPNATISGYKPLNQLADLLKMNQLRKMALNNVNLSFEFENGRVYVQPFDVVYQDIKMTIFGSNGFDQTLDYTINMEVPRALLGPADQLMSQLSKQAANRGVKLELQPNINIKVRMTGTVSDPKVSADLSDMTSGAAGNLKDQAREELERRKKELEDKARAEAERLRRELESKKSESEQKAREELERQRQRAKQEADKILSDAKVQSDRLRSEGKRAADVIRKEGDDAAKKLISEAGNNPVKKAAAELAARKLREESEEKARRTEAEANNRADQLTAEARRRADALLNP
ncbi:MAG: AsmA-like C-terminal region-containing protein [Bacteroidia bacterium]